MNTSSVRMSREEFGAVEIGIEKRYQAAHKFSEEASVLLGRTMLSLIVEREVWFAGILWMGSPK